MNRVDLQQFLRFAIGFDDIANILDDITDNHRKQNHYPPYNIEKLGEEHYCITIAVAGFEENNLDITMHSNILSLEGKIKKSPPHKEHVFLYKGIAERSFQLQFRLADHMEIKKVFLENGMLRVFMLREVPEALKPQKIKIDTISKDKRQSTNLIEGQIKK